MKPIPRTLLGLLATAALCWQASAVSAQEVPAPSAAGQKIDSGLGELPHYRYWADPTGKTPMVAKVSGQKIDSGLGDLPHYRYWADPTGKAPLRSSEVVADSSPRR